MTIKALERTILANEMELASATSNLSSLKTRLKKLQYKVGGHDADEAKNLEEDIVYEEGYIAGISNSLNNSYRIRSIVCLSENNTAKPLNPETVVRKLQSVKSHSYA